jgi:hypothetical protein
LKRIIVVAVVQGFYIIIRWVVVILSPLAPARPPFLRSRYENKLSPLNMEICFQISLLKIQACRPVVWITILLIVLYFLVFYGVGYSMVVGIALFFIYSKGHSAIIALWNEQSLTLPQKK